MRPLLTKAGRGFCAATLEDLTGQVEVTVWPDTYEQQRELWAEGKIVRLTARIRQRDDRLDVAVVNAAEFDPQAEGGVPAEIAAAVAEVDRLVPGRPPEQANGYRNGNGRGRNGNGYKNGNGYGNGNGAPVPSGPPPRFLLRIEITERPEDEADDRRRLNELVQVLGAAPGKDEVHLVLCTQAQRYELELTPVSLSPALEERLRPILAPDDWGRLYPEALPVPA